MKNKEPSPANVQSATDFVGKDSKTLTNAFPSLLGGAELVARPLPVDFDMQLHTDLHRSGKVKATSLTELKRKIKELEAIRDKRD